MAVRQFVWPLLAALVLGVFAGGLTGWRGPERAGAHIANQAGHIGPYSYGDSRCRNPVDPITVIFVGNATTANVNTHSAHHGGWSYSGPSSGQYFYQHGCRRPAGDIASGNLLSLQRYHMRHVSGVDATQGTYSLGTPHREDLVFCGVLPNHAVDSNWNEEPGGYVRGKWQIADTWHFWTRPAPDAPVQDHYFVDSQYWNNTAAMWQCDGEPAWNDGWVDFVSIR
jgi:hypothetical protein